MAYAIIAEAVLGTYHGHTEGGRLDEVPSPARLAAALLCAAAQGPRAEQEGDELRPCEVDAAVLRWLENNPPDGIRVPRRHANRSDAKAYRIRLTETRAGRRGFYPAGDRLDSVAVDGAYAWTWRAGPPATLRDALADLCGDVAYLGMAESPVRMWAGTAEPTHDLTPDADWWARARDDLDLDVPEAGRIQALMAAHQTARRSPPAREPIVSVEPHVSPARPAGGITPARYASRRPKPPEMPWHEVLLATADKGLHPKDEAGRVRWAVAAHKALIKIIGYGAPPVLTGKYAPGVPRPANRCAIQALTAEEAAKCGVPGKSLLALMVPADIDGADHAVISAAWRTLTELHPVRRVRLSHHTSERADTFWKPPADDHARLWYTTPAAVPETRAQGKGWTLEDAVHLSAGMVLRERLGVAPGKGSRWYQELVSAVRDGGFGVASAVPVRDGDLTRFIHKIPDRLPLRPYRALIDFAGLVPTRGLMAIGQARHLGNGLLVPIDVPVGGER